MNEQHEDPINDPERQAAIRGKKLHEQLELPFGESDRPRVDESDEEIVRAIKEKR